jgi:hypothetical protein
MHTTRSNQTHEGRLQDREAQSRGWASPVPTPQNFNIHDGTRTRVEWETRDTINNRLWADTISAGPKAVTAAMLAAHVSHGSETMLPANSRKDNRPYHDNVQYYPDAAAPRDGLPQDRPVLPARNLDLNPWTNHYDIESGDIARELRGAVKESNRFFTQDVSARMAGRTFEHQWIPAAASRAIAEQKLEASELLRPAQDDYRRNFLPGA